MIIYAEDVPYFQTSQAFAESWIEKAKREISSINGKINAEAFGMDDTGRSAFILAFSIGTDTFKLTWPVLPSKKGNQKAAKIQAATALYHDVKARVVSAKFLGLRGAFFNYLMLPGGKTAADVTGEAFLELVPKMMLLHDGKTNGRS